MPLPFELSSAMDIKGTGLPTQQPPRRRFEKGKGWTTIEIWEGPTESGIYGKAIDLQTAGYTEIDIYSPQPGIWRVEASIPGQSEGDPPDPAENEWVIIASTDMRDVRSHPLFGATITSEEINKIVDVIGKEKPMPTLGSAPAQVLGRKLYDLLSHGHTTFRHLPQILRHTQTVATFEQVVFSYAGVGNVVSSASLPSGITPAVVTAINTIPTGPVISGMVQGWLKTSAEVRQNIFSRVDILEEWLWDYHSLDLFA